MANAFLKVVPGARQGLNVPLEEDEPLVIGRKRGDLLLDDALVSSTHAQIIARDDGWVIQDLGSTNGTLVDGRLIREVVLKPGAEIAVGQTRMVLFIGLSEQEPAEVEPAPAAQSQLEIAWLLDEELVELRGSADRTRANTDVIDQDLRLPPGMHAVVEVVAGNDVGKVYRFTRGNISIGRKLGEIPLSDLEVSFLHSDNQHGDYSNNLDDTGTNENLACARDLALIIESDGEAIWWDFFMNGRDDDDGNGPLHYLCGSSAHQALAASIVELLLAERPPEYLA